jgi:hypothetical protein
MSIILVGILASVGAMVTVQGMKTYYAIDDLLPTMTKLRDTTWRIAQELKEIDFNGTAYLLTATYPSTANGSITFTKLDGTVVVIDGSTSSMTMKYDAGSAYTLTDKLSDLTFNFYQYDGTTNATDATDARFIEINVTLLLDGNTYAQRTRIGLRDPA